MKQIITVAIFLAFCTPYLLAQEFEDLSNENRTYYNEIRSVKLHPEGVPLSHAIIPLGSGSRLHLSFDDLENDVMDYAYTIVHCDKDWQRSELEELEYLDGFTGELLELYSSSFNTYASYTHYDLFLPNEDLRWTQSGNYLLIIYDQDNDNEVVLTRRFMVTENVVQVEAQAVPVMKIGKNRSHQEIDFTIFHERFEIRNPQADLSVSVIQNGHWDNAITDLKPLFLRKNELSFDYQGKIVFPGLNEYRLLDLRYMPTTSGNVAQVSRPVNRFEALLFPECKRWDVPYLFYADIDGQFIIGRGDEPRPERRSDYIDVLFTFCNRVPEGHDVYLYGEITNWNIREDFKLEIDPSIGDYTLMTPLKEGFYNYAYAFVDRKTKAVKFDETEGNWFQTTNDYTVLVYYRPFSGRFDRLIAAYTVPSMRQ